MSYYNVVYNKAYKYGLAISSESNYSDLYFPSVKKTFKISSDDLETINSESLQIVKKLTLFDIVNLGLFDFLFTEDDFKKATQLVDLKVVKITFSNYIRVDGKYRENGIERIVKLKYINNLIDFNVDGENIFNAYTCAFILMVKSIRPLSPYIQVNANYEHIPYEENKITSLESLPSENSTIKNTLMFKFLTEFTGEENETKKILLVQQYNKKIEDFPGEYFNFNHNAKRYLFYFPENEVQQLKNYLLHSVLYRKVNNLAPNGYISYLKNDYSSYRYNRYNFDEYDYLLSCIINEIYSDCDRYVLFMSYKRNQRSKFLILIPLLLNHLSFDTIINLNSSVKNIDYTYLKEDKNFLAKNYMEHREFIENEIGVSFSITKEKFHNDLINKDIDALLFDFTLMNPDFIDEEDPGMVFAYLYKCYISKYLKRSRFLEILEALPNNALLLDLCRKNYTHRFNYYDYYDEDEDYDLDEDDLPY